MDKEKICSLCEEPIDGEDFMELGDGSIVCPYCYENETVECAICGEYFLEDDMSFWGAAQICPTCLENQCPSFDQEDNEKKTQEAYGIFCAKYIGRKVLDQKPGEIDLDTTVGDETPTCYSISITVDQNGVITGISRLKASMMLSEWERGADWRPYPISNDDYEFWAEDLLEDNLEFDEESENED